MAFLEKLWKLREQIKINYLSTKSTIIFKFQTDCFPHQYWEKPTASPLTIYYYTRFNVSLHLDEQVMTLLAAPFRMSPTLPGFLCSPKSRLTRQPVHKTFQQIWCNRTVQTGLEAYLKRLEDSKFGLFYLPNFYDFYKLLTP